jgi:sulfite exporter TauE/SafE
MDYATAFVLGLFGSLHCAGMCGPLVLALPPVGRATIGRVAGRLVYHVGRITMYCALGVVFGLFGKTLFLAGLQRALSIGLGALLLAGLFASRRFGASQPIGRMVSAVKFRMSAQLRRRTFAGLGLLGLLNGLLPCGLVYVAGAGAAATGSTGSGMIYMAVFGAGTLPLMVALSLFGQLIPVSCRTSLARAVPVSVFLLGSLLILRGLSLGIPYVSPALSGASCCRL